MSKDDPALIQERHLAWCQPRQRKVALLLGGVLQDVQKVFDGARRDLAGGSSSSADPCSSPTRAFFNSISVRASTASVRHDVRIRCAALHPRLCARDVLDQIQFAFDDSGDTLNQWTARSGLRPIIGCHVDSGCVINCIGNTNAGVSSVLTTAARAGFLAKRAIDFLTMLGTRCCCQSIMPD